MFDCKIVHNSMDKSWIVLIHGLGGNAETWKKQEKAYAQSYNLLLLNMHKDADRRNDAGPLSVRKICDQIKDSLDHYGIPKAHMVSISSGSLIALAFLSIYPMRVEKLVMGGGIIRFNARTNILLFFANALRKIIPYMYLYSFFAFIIMPRNNHKKSRQIFNREAKKIGKIEFRSWIEVISELNDTKSAIQSINALADLDKTGCFSRILYILGSQDYLFIGDTRKYYKELYGAEFVEISDCGHVCAIEKAEEFTKLSLDFMNR